MCPCGLWVRGDDKLHSVPPNCSHNSRTAASSSSQGGQQIPPSTAGPWLTSSRGGGGAGRPRSSSLSQQGDLGRAGPLVRPRGCWGTSFPGAVSSDPTQPLRDPRCSVFCVRETGSSGKGRAPPPRGRVVPPPRGQVSRIAQTQDSVHKHTGPRASSCGARRLDVGLRTTLWGRSRGKGESGPHPGRGSCAAPLTPAPSPEGQLCTSSREPGLSSGLSCGRPSAAPAGTEEEGPILLTTPGRRFLSGISECL